MISTEVIMALNDHGKIVAFCWKNVLNKTTETFIKLVFTQINNRFTSDMSALDIGDEKLM
jgi:hypothetical protein